MAFDPSLAWERSQGLLTGGSDGTARVWNTFSHGACAGECTREVEQQGHDFRTLTTTDKPTDNSQTQPAHDKDVTKVVYSPDGRSFLSVGFDNVVRLWENSTNSADPAWMSKWRGAQVKKEIKGERHNGAAAWTYEDQFAAGFVYHTALHRSCVTAAAPLIIQFVAMNPHLLMFCTCLQFRLDRQSVERKWAGAVQSFRPRQLRPRQP